MRLSIKLNQQLLIATEKTGEEAADLAEDAAEEVANLSEEVGNCLQDHLEEAKLLGLRIFGLGLLGSNVVRIGLAALALALYELMLVRRYVVGICCATLGALTLCEGATRLELIRSTIPKR